MLVPVVGTTHAVKGSLVVGIVVLSFQLRILQADRHRPIGIGISETILGQAVTVQDGRIVRAAHVSPTLRRVHHVENPSLGVDGLLRIVTQRIVSNERIYLFLGNLVGCKIVVVEQLHAGTNTSLVVALSITTTYIPTLGCSLSLEELHLSIAHQVARTRRHLEVDVQARTTSSGYIIRDGIIVLVNLCILLQSRKIIHRSWIHPVCVPGCTRVARLLTEVLALEVSQEIICQVDVLFLIWLHLTTLDIVVVTADAIETRVVGILQLIEQGRAYHGRRCGILTIESLAQCIGTEIVVVGSIIIGKWCISILDISIIGCTGDSTGSHSLLKLLLCLLWICIRNAHGIAHTECIGILLPLSYITTHAGDIARNAVGTCAKLLLASVKFLKEPAVEFLYGIILRGGDT